MPLTQKQMEYLALAWQCFESEPKIDYAHFAEVAGLKTPHSARELMRVTKNKLKAEYGTLSGEMRANNTPVSSPAGGKKSGGVSKSATGGGSVRGGRRGAVSAAAVAKGRGRGGGKKARIEKEEGHDGKEGDGSSGDEEEDEKEEDSGDGMVKKAKTNGSRVAESASLYEHEHEGPVAGGTAHFSNHGTKKPEISTTTAKENSSHANESVKIKPEPNDDSAPVDLGGRAKKKKTTNDTPEARTGFFRQVDREPNPYGPENRGEDFFHDDMFH